MEMVKGHGLANTVAWTQLAQAMRADGMSVGDTCPPHIAAFIREVVSAALASRPADTGERGVATDAMVDAGAKKLADEYDRDRYWEEMGEADRDHWRIQARQVLTAALRAQPAGGGEDWQARALSAEADIERMTDAFNRENGPTFMGEPVLPPEKMVELEPGVRVPKWLLDDTRRVELYMKANLPGPWRIGGIQSHDYKKEIDHD